MMNKQLLPKVGLLPCYLKLYDDRFPERRRECERFLQEITTMLRGNALEVECAPICRVADEFDTAIRTFEESKVDAVITLHLAYSPSLESIDSLCSTELPLIILDTAMDAEFGRNVSPGRIQYNHGVHGVMDMACMMRRRGRSFEIVAGHYRESNVVSRAADLARAAVAARTFRNSRLLRVGDAFVGMGDFAVEPHVLAQHFGMEIDQISLDALDDAISKLPEEAIAAETAKDREAFNCDVDEETHTRSVRVGLGLRALIEEGHYNGFSVNFKVFDRADRSANTMPFLEISKAMARGIGYAGEGDVLTAALVGALASAFGATTFTEIFCADWGGNALFLSHMGEISPSVSADQPRVFAKTMMFGSDLPDAAVLTCAVQPGPAVFVNLAPGPDDTFTLIVAPVEVLPEDESLDPKMRDTVRAWVRPSGGDVAAFLEAYSRAGGTHHSALVLGDRSEAILAFARAVGIETCTL